MKHNNISALSKIKNENFENIFNVYQDNNSFYYYNLLQTLAFPQNLPDGYFEPYTIMYGDSWPYISYKVYDSPNIWWVILIANNIQNPITSLVPGTTIKIPKLEIVNTIISLINNQNE